MQKIIFSIVIATLVSVQCFGQMDSKHNLVKSFSLRGITTVSLALHDANWRVRYYKPANEAEAIVTVITNVDDKNISDDDFEELNDLGHFTLQSEKLADGSLLISNADIETIAVNKRPLQELRNYIIEIPDYTKIVSVFKKNPLRVN